MRDGGKVKVFETSHYLFEKELIDEARDDEDGGFIDFADEDEGKEIKFRASEVSFAGHKYKEFKSFSFEDREEPLSKEVLKQAISFDEIMEIPTYEEVEKIFYGVDEEDEKSEKKSKTVENDDEENEDDEVSKKSSKEQDEDDDEEKPIKKSKPVDDDEEDEKPEETEKSCNKNCGECPFGHKFGKDTDEFDDCDDCDVWDKCVKAGD